MEQEMEVGKEIGHTHKSMPKIAIIAKNINFTI